MKKICVITANRSEYGLLRWIMTEIKEEVNFDLKIIVTGAHLSSAFGYTVNDIVDDGFEISAKIDMLLDSNTQTAIIKSIGLCEICIADILNNISPDLIIVLGDRYELLPVCIAALIMRIPIAHISGGDITLGVIDNEIRNALTMISDFHFTGTKEAAKRILRMGKRKESIFCVGEPGLDNFNRMNLISRNYLAKDLKIDSKKKWILFTYHPETKLELSQNIDAINNALKVLLSDEEVFLIATYANPDSGGKELNLELNKAALKYNSSMIVMKSLGQLRYLSIMAECVCIAGNSSSGIVEAPFLGIPVINIGDRQKGRYFSANITSCSHEFNDINDAYKKIKNGNFIKYNPDNYYGTGFTAKKIVKTLKKIDF